MKVLIVDDNIDITDMFTKYLSLKGYETTASNNGANGLSLIKNQDFDYIILDMSMPEFGGMDVVDALEKEDLLKDKKIVILTASSISHSEVEELTSKNGIVTILKKPVQLSELLQVLSN
ncbi:MAG: response regulator [Nitrosopumilus sp.]